MTQNKHETPSKKPPSASHHRAGQAEDEILQEMKELHLPMTRASYLTLAYWPDLPDELSAEEEALLPEQFQQWDEK